MTLLELAQRMGAPGATPYRHLAVIGGGAWGSALAAAAARAGREVTIWARRPELAAEIDLHKTNGAAFGPDVALPRAVRATADLAAAASRAEAALLVVPSVSVRETARALAAALPAGAPVVLCAKGIERATGLLMSAVVLEESPGRGVGILSGPTFAAEVVRDLPTAVTIASPCAASDGEASVAARMALSLGSERFRPYLSDDMTGAEVGGAVKNVVAIACGMAEGAGFGSNARAALITRGLDEIKQLAEALGGRRETVTGLSGAGDLMLTCSSTQSRNFSFGVQVGRGVPANSLFDGRPVVVEGVENALSVTELARRTGVGMPICELTRAVIHEGVDFARAFERLWTAPIESEPRAMDLELAHPFAGRVA